MSVQIKICGLTSVSDALAASDAGADFIGLIFAPESPRAVTPAIGADLHTALAGRARTVGVFRNAEVKTILAIHARVGFDLVQLHGRESPDFCRQMPVPVIKVFEITPELTAAEVAAYRHAATWFLFDRPKGETSPDWTVRAARFLATVPPPLPFFFAGGLTADSVSGIVRDVAPFGVDVASGVEVSPREKDPARMTAFCEAARKGHF
jgi:phosphoribosylanthranilate isomerase